jgi:hypothetical protein
MTMASNFLRGTTLTPDVANDLCVTSGAFVGYFLIVEKAAESLGIYAPDAMRLRGKIGDQAIPIKIRDVLTTGIAILHVNHNLELSRGEYPQGAHFVLALRRVTIPTGLARFECLDPTPRKARVWFNDADTCTGTTQWGMVQKTYRAVGVIPIFKARPLVEGMRR